MTAPAAREARTGPLLTLAVAAAFGTGLAAVREHDACTAAGYALAEAQRASVALTRDVVRAERRVAALRAPHVVLARSRAFGLGLEYPSHWNVVRAADLVPVPERAPTECRPPAGDAAEVSDAAAQAPGDGGAL